MTPAHKIDLEGLSTPPGLAMQALRVIKTPDNHQVVIDLPPGMDNARQVEVIVLAVEEVEAAVTASTSITAQPKRKPSHRLAGTRSVGDIMAPAVSESDWDALQ